MKQTTNTTQKRLKILGDDEIFAIYQRPHFTHEERIEYFSISPKELAAMEQLHSIKSRIYYILQLGYFKARHLFFFFNLTEVSLDARYIIEQYFPNFQLTDLEIAKVTRLKQQGLILELCNYRLCGTEQRQELESKAQQTASVCCKPIYIFRELMDDLAEQRIVAPGYSFMQNTVGKALTYEHSRLITIVQDHLANSDIDALKSLFNDSQGLYEITQLKREPKDFTLSEIKREIDRVGQIRHLYHLTKRLLPHLAISNESIKYYASLVTYYSVFRLRQLNAQIVYIYLLCFVYTSFSLSCLRLR